MNVSIACAVLCRQSRTTSSIFLSCSAKRLMCSWCGELAYPAGLFANTAANVDRNVEELILTAAQPWVHLPTVRAESSQFVQRCQICSLLSLVLVHGRLIASLIGHNNGKWYYRNSLPSNIASNSPSYGTACE